MDFLSDFASSFLIYFVIFIVLSVIVMIIRGIRMRSKTKGFRAHLAKNFPTLDAEIPMLMAKSKSKQGKPDMAMVIDGGKEEVIILKNISGKQIEQFVYPAGDMTFLNRGSKMIGRGFAPKTWSYEEHLELIFKDGIHHLFFLENISNKSGTDKGADLVREMFDPWFKQLSVYYDLEKPET
jgi:hypothetical protein